MMTGGGADGGASECFPVCVFVYACACVCERDSCSVPSIINGSNSKSSTSSPEDHGKSQLHTPAMDLQQRSKVKTHCYSILSFSVSYHITAADAAAVVF